MTRLITALALALSLAGCGKNTDPSPVTNFAGQWVGQHRATACTNTNPNSAVCPLYLNGSALPLTVTLTQSGTTASGTVQLGTIQISASGPVSADGVLSLSGSGTIPGVSGSVVTLTTWRTTQSGSTMNGTFRFSQNVGDISTIDSTLVNVVRQ